MLLKLVDEYTDQPGARYEYQGPYSGERFRDEILYNKFIEALEKNESLVVDLDGGYGYGPSFLEESFGGLVRKLKEEKSDNYKKVKNIKIISNDNEKWIGKIDEYIQKAIDKPLRKEK